LLRSLQEIQPDFEEEEEAKAWAGLWSQGKKKELVRFTPPGKSFPVPTG
jgi:hypothetical protein